MRVHKRRTKTWKNLEYNTLTDHHASKSDFNFLFIFVCRRVEKVKIHTAYLVTLIQKNIEANKLLKSKVLGFQHLNEDISLGHSISFHYKNIF